MNSDLESKKENTAYTGVDGLFAMWTEAIRMYKIAVQDFGIHYDHFAEDFINSHSHPNSPDAWSRNQHAVILGRIRQFLRYESMLRHYSTLEPSFEHFEECMAELMLSVSAAETPHFDFQCHFSPSIISLITEAVNSIPLFRSEVSEADMDHLFNDCKPVAVPRLIARNNQHLAYFLCLMDSYGLICRNYQQVIEKIGLIGSPKSGRALKAHDLARALSSINSRSNPIKEKIDTLVKKIKYESIIRGN